ncbi:MAG: acyl carrier protein [Deltaproteobacteria bacterium]|nr:acyl carrier protein [Deltaproteobacteria bacterium]
MGVDKSEISDNVNFSDIESWDSLRHVILIGNIEKTFSIKFETDDIIAMETLGTIKKIVKKYIEKGSNQ